MKTTQSVSIYSRREQLKALGVASLGGMLEYFEFIIFVFLATYISAHFTPADTPEWVRLMQTFGIFAAGFLVRPVGGILMAQLGDLIGRKRIFTISLAFMAGPTLVIGLLPGYEQIGIWAPLILLLCRLLQGISLGGELPGAISFVSEQVSGRHVAFALAVIAASTTLGSLLGSLVVSALTGWLGEEFMLEWGWRLPFMIGGVFGAVSVYLRRFTHETPVFKAMQEHNMLTERAPFKVVVSQHRGNLLLAMVMASATAVIAASTQHFPISYFSTARAMPLEPVSAMVSMMIALTLIGNLLGGLLVLFRVVSLLACYLVFQLATIGAVFWAFSQTEVSGLLLPFIVLGISSGVTMALSLTFMARAFPASIRYTGLATCYNIPVAVFGGTALLVMTFIASQSLVIVPVYPVVFSALSIGAVLMLWPRRHAISPFEGDDPDAPMMAYATHAELRQG